MAKHNFFFLLLSPLERGHWLGLGSADSGLQGAKGEALRHIFWWMQGVEPWPWRRSSTNLAWYGVGSGCNYITLTVPLTYMYVCVNHGSSYLVQNWFIACNFEHSTYIHGHVHVNEANWKPISKCKFVSYGTATTSIFKRIILQPILNNVRTCTYVRM